MELKYTRTFSRKTKLYSVGEIPIMYGLAMEILDPRAKLSEGKLQPGETAVVLYGITPEEYALKDGDPKALDALAEKLTREAPADRLIGLQLRDLKGAAIQREIKLQTGDSIDGGAFMKRLAEARANAPKGPFDEALLEVARQQRACADKNAPEEAREALKAARRSLGETLRGAEELIVAYDAPMGGRFPSIGFDGRVEVFTIEARAKRVMEQTAARLNGVELWTLKTLKGEELKAFLNFCEAYAFLQLRVDNGFAAAELSVAELRGGEAKRVENAELRGLILREMQYGVRWNKFREANAPEPAVRGALESMLTLRNWVRRALGNALIYVASPAGSDTRGRCCTHAAWEKLENAENARILSDIHCAVATEQKTGKRFAAAFSSAAAAMAFAGSIKANVRPVPVLATFDDLAGLAANCDGLMIDGMYRVPKQDFDSVRDLRGKPPVVVKVKTKEQEAQEKQEAEIPQPRTGPGAQLDSALPDPDSFDLPEPPAQAEKAEEQPEPAESAAKTEPAPEKKGFFKRLFGK